MIRTFTPTLHYDRARLLRRERIHPEAPAYTRFCAQLDKAENALRAAARPECLWLSPDERFPLEDTVLSGAAEQFLCAATLGEDIHSLIREEMERGAYLAGYVLNALADELLFSVSEELNAAVARDICARGLFLSPALFPGSELPLSRQSEFLRVLHTAGALRDVSITEGSMLRPEKTMLWLLAADSTFERGESAHDCARCTRENCTYRT